MTRRRALLAIVALLVVAGAVVGIQAWRSDRGDQPSIRSAAAADVIDFDYLISAGTGARIDRGEPVSIIPEQLVAHVGQTIRIVNEDDRGHLVGPFYLGAGQTLTQTFASPGELVGECSVHPSGHFVLKVLP